MALLINRKHEHFAQLVANGEKPEQAYVTAGYSEKGAIQSASRLLKNADVLARITELKEKVTERVVEKSSVDRAWVLNNLQVVAMRCMQAAPVLDRKGNPVFIETPNGEISPAFTFDAAGANRSLELIGKELGMFVERKEIRTGLLDGIPHEQLKELQAALDEVIELRPSDYKQIAH